MAKHKKPKKKRKKNRKLLGLGKDKENKRASLNT
jgi:hypothetical protein